MKLSIKGSAWAGGLLWAGSFFVASIINLIRPSYSLTFLNMLESIYPGYHAGQGFVSVIVGTGYALIDGIVAGALLAWLYNRFS